MTLSLKPFTWLEAFNVCDAYNSCFAVMCDSIGLDIVKGERKLRKTNTPIEVRYQETDQMGVVYHANYLIWFEIGRTKYIESLGFTYMDMENNQIVSPVTDAQVQFKQPVRYGEKATVETWLEDYDGIRTVYGYRILNENDEIAVTGTTTHVIVHKESFRPMPLRKAYPEWHQAYLKELNGES